MAVYTHLSAEALEQLLGYYDVGELVSAKGIAEGVSNSNWLVETTGGSNAATRYILTMYERRIDLDDLPFFLSLLDHLSAKGAPVPRTIHDREGNASRMVEGKAVALIEFLPGISVETPTAAQAHHVGAALASTHLAVADFPLSRAQALGLATWDQTIHQCGNKALADIDPQLPDTAFDELSFLAGNWPGGLPHGVVHCDLFPDNVLMLGDRVSGLIDYYFAANDFFAYDLAVTHAAWCFSEGGKVFRPDVSSALLGGYQSVRPMTEAEHEALPILARGACMRFISSRAHDWIEMDGSPALAHKHPVDFMRRLSLYRKHGAAAFRDATD